MACSPPVIALLLSVVSFGMPPSDRETDLLNHPRTLTAVEIQIVLRRVLERMTARRFQVNTGMPGGAIYIVGANGRLDGDELALDPFLRILRGEGTISDIGTRLIGRKLARGFRADRPDGPSARTA